MKKKSKRLNNLNEWISRFRELIRHPLRLTGFALSLLVLLTLFHLLVLGLPDPLTQRIAARIRAAGIPLQMDAIRL